MEAVTLAGIAVVAVGGYYSAVDFLTGLGIRSYRTKLETRNSQLFSKRIFTPQRRIKKVAGMHI